MDEFKEVQIQEAEGERDALERTLASVFRGFRASILFEAKVLTEEQYLKEAGNWAQSCHPEQLTACEHCMASAIAAHFKS